MASQIVSAEKRYRMSLLLDTYGELLTDKQRTFLHRYYEEDFSFGEIAREFDVSRQAIFDSVKHGEASLENYERVLGLVKTAGKKETPGTQSAALDSIQNSASECAARLKTLAEAISLSSIDSDVTWITREMESIWKAMEAIGAPVETESSRESETEIEEETPTPRKSKSTPSLLRRGGPEVD